MQKGRALLPRAAAEIPEGRLSCKGSPRGAWGSPSSWTPQPRAQGQAEVPHSTGCEHEQGRCARETSLLEKQAPSQRAKTNSFAAAHVGPGEGGQSRLVIGRRRG